MESALCTNLQCQPLGEMCRELGILQNSRFIFPPAKPPPAASHSNQLIHSMESASLPSHKSPCPLNFPKASQRPAGRECAMVFQIRGLAPGPGKCAYRRDVMLPHIMECSSAIDISITPQLVIGLQTRVRT